MSTMLSSFVGAIVAVFVALGLACFGGLAVWFFRRREPAVQTDGDYRGGFGSGIFEDPLGAGFDFDQGPVSVYYQPSRLWAFLRILLVSAVLIAGVGAIGWYVNWPAAAIVAGAALVLAVASNLILSWWRKRRFEAECDELDRYTRKSFAEVCVHGRVSTLTDATGVRVRWCPDCDSTLPVAEPDPADYVEAGDEAAPPG